MTPPRSQGFVRMPDAEFEAIRARGARVVMEPTRQQYGGTDALIDDTVGNIICLHQD